MNATISKGRDGWEAKTTVDMGTANRVLIVSTGKAIKITPENFPAIVATLAAVNGKAAEHCYTTADEIESVAKAAENKLERLGLPKAERPGAKVFATSGAAVANAYKYGRKATYVAIERKGAGWYLIAVEPSSVFKEGGATKMQLTKAQDERAIAALRKQYSVAAEGAAA